MTALPTPAQYLLRVDDLCPTLAAAPWRRILALIQEFHLRPILAIVPDNRDPELEREPANHEFWQDMRRLYSTGATIGLHGYTHVCSSNGRSLLKLSSRSEFAGVAESQQRAWIQDGLQILRRNGLDPRVWVAPRHGFDQTTLCILRAEGIHVLSDGLARWPFLHGGATWIPQQLWGPVAKKSGLWTICLHPNTIGDAEIERLRSFLHVHAAQFTSVDRVMAECPAVPLTIGERVYSSLALWRIRMRQAFDCKVRAILSSHTAPPTDPAHSRG